ncbi:hypothetical protein JCM10212_000096 [Sporobolomyces blumeae]
MASLSLSHLHLDPTPLGSVPTSDDPSRPQFERELVDEALSLLDSELWTEKKQHHKGIVETTSLPVDKVRYKTETGGTETKSPTGQPDGEGIAWHKRTSDLSVSEYGGYDEWFAAMGDRHTEQEQEYVDSLVDLIDIGKDEGKEGCFLKLYKLPFGATDRSFMCHTLVVKPKGGKDDKKGDGGDNDHDNASDNESLSELSSKAGSRSFLTFSLPITTPSPHPSEKKYVRGTTVTVERIMEVDDGKTIRWICASLSTPGGSIPVKLGESKMAASLADAVPPILSWMKKAHPPGSGLSTRGAGGPADMEAASKKAPVAARTTRGTSSAMGIMPQGRFTLEMFQRPVQLREY